MDKDIVWELAEELKIPVKTIEAVFNSQSKFIRESFEGGSRQKIRVAHFGTFDVIPYRIQWGIKNYMPYYQKYWRLIEMPVNNWTGKHKKLYFQYTRLAEIGSRSYGIIHRERRNARNQSGSKEHS